MAGAAFGHVVQERGERGGVVADHGAAGGGGGPQVALPGDDRDARVQQPRNGAVAHLGIDHQQPVDPRGDPPARAARRGEEHHVEPFLLGARDGPEGEVHVVVQPGRGLRQVQPDGPGAGAAQPPGRAVGPVAELLRHRADPFPGRFGDASRALEGVGDGALGDPGGAGYVEQGHGPGGHGGEV
ncbi:hypothetical protein Smic_37250 [Streptomyces microflavus]|uniref:Uncharacterized protein n=1 Tax=Streptomyces microflavus TaxID=1919 RepID=A0A7J0CS97_STRMI|nr:hypothetical protein Smic_37250 [Streptomyces microflavus]